MSGNNVQHPVVLSRFVNFPVVVDEPQLRGFPYDPAADAQRIADERVAQLLRDGAL
jgi:hypothetical protein